MRLLSWLSPPFEQLLAVVTGLQNGSLRCLLLFTLLMSFQPSASAVTLNCSASYQISQTFTNGAKWDMCWERKDREGIIYSDIHYTTPSGIERKVLSEAAIAQIHVPYDDNGARYHDVSDYGLGMPSYLNDLQAIDCPSGTRLQEGGKNMVCRSLITGEVSAYDNGVSIPTEMLSVYSVSHVGAYNYIPEYRFYDTGMIEPIMGATGRLQRYGSDPAEGWSVRTGTNPIGISHLHNYYWKLDFDLGNSGTDDIFEEIEFVAEDSTNTTFAKSVTAFSTETSRSMQPSTKRFWRVRDDTEQNADGFPISYDILALETGHRDTGPTSEPWTFDDIYATRYRACERFISHNPSDPGGCGSNGDVSDFVNGESLTNEDLVLWFGITFHHIPRDEDEPYMHAHWNHYRLIPRDWTAGSVNNIDFAPVVNNLGEQHSLEGSVQSQQIVANDANGDTMTYSAVGLPVGLTIDVNSGLISGTLSASLGTYSVDVTVSDSVNNTIMTFDWIVSDDPDSDGVVSSIDNCPSVSNVSQLDTDNDSVGDACDVGASVLWSDSFETGNSWSINPVGTDTATTGVWEVGNPQQTISGSSVMQLEDASEGIFALVTDPDAGSSVGTFDIDNGATTARSPAINLPVSGDISLSLDYYFAHLSNATSDDYFQILVVDSSNTTLATIYSALGNSAERSEDWQTISGFSLNAFQGQTVMIQVSAADASGGSIVEAGIDQLVIEHTELDTDIDGIADANDNCPSIANNDQSDVDSDGLGDVCDSFPNDPDNDLDGDSIGGDIDNCPSIANNNQANDDGDGQGNVCDSFPLDPDNDFDGDGISGHIDNCSLVANVSQIDADADGLGDACDPFPSDPDNDFDGDGVSGPLDNCPLIANSAQSNVDADGFGDACDAFPNDPDNDIDGDGVGGDTDNCPTLANSDQANDDGDALGNICDGYPLDPDNDIDGDGVSGHVDNCPLQANTDQSDNDNDDAGDVCDSDDDNDGLSDTEEQTLGTDPLLSDTDTDTLSDYDEVNIHLTNPLVIDTDGDGVSDADELTFGTDPNVFDGNIPMPLWLLTILPGALTLIGWHRLRRRSDV